MRRAPWCVNLQPIRPQLFAPSIAPRLGIDMPQVASGTHAEATITMSLTAAAKTASADAGSTAAGFTVVSATPKRVSARLSVRAEDIASVGQANFEAALRQNLSLVLSDELDKQVINGDGSAPNLSGLLKALDDPSAPAAGVATFDTFLAVFADAVEGLWAMAQGAFGADRRSLLAMVQDHRRGPVATAEGSASVGRQLCVQPARCAGGLAVGSRCPDRYEPSSCRQPFYADIAAQAVDGPDLAARIVGIKRDGRNPKM